MPHGNVAGLEDGPNLHGEGLAALVALVSANPGALAAHLGNALHAAAMRADGPFGQSGPQRRRRRLLRCESGRGHRGRAYWSGCSYHSSDAPLVVVALSGRASYPYQTIASKGYIGTRLYSLAEAAVFVVAHELRHLWQAKVKRGWRVWGAKGQFSERDADAYAIQMVRRYRRGELAC
jgi:hypothetical protein